jgi:hypothetical protein
LKAPGETRGVAPLHSPQLNSTFVMNAPTAPVVILYTRVGWHLCDDARDALVRHGLAPVEVDIDRDESLKARYHECVPVVVIDGVERFRGRVNEVLLRRLVGRRGGGCAS